MSKQVHIHIHRSKARDAGEGKGKWITLSPSGTHVKVDGKGEIAAGPKGMAGKKPSELSSGPKEGEVGHSEHQKYGAYFKKGEHVRGPGGKVHEVFSHVGPAVETSGGRFHPTKVSRAAPSTGKAEGGTHEEDRKHFLNVVRDPKKATTAQLREAIDYWHEVGTKAGHGGQEHAASQQRMRMAVSELQARGEKVPGFERPKVVPSSPNQKIAAEMGKVAASKAPAVNPSTIKEGQALYDKSGQKVDEVESIQRRTLGKGLTINTRAGYQVHIDESGANAQGWTNEKGAQR